MARVDAAKKKKPEVREVAESRSRGAFAFTIESHGRALEL